MLETEYKRDMHANYLVIKESGQCLNNTYNYKMLLNNTIPGLLKLELRIVDNINLYYYDVTSKQPLDLLLEKGQLIQGQIKKIMYGIINGIERGKEFLLNENDFVLEPQLIFVNLSGFELSLCHVVGYNKDIRKQICTVIEFLMNKVDHREEEAVLLIYGLYKVSRELDCTFDGLLEVMRGKNIVNKPVDEDAIIEEREEKKIDKPSPLIIEEPVDSEEEIAYYAKKTWLYCGCSILAVPCILFIFAKTGALYSENSSKVDLIKLMVLLVIISYAEYYSLSKILNKKNMEIKIKQKYEYNSVHKLPKIPSEEFADMEFMHSPDNHISFDNSEQTVVLYNTESQGIYKLSPEDQNRYEEIELVEFPFFIGNLKTKVDYAIENKVISRFHAKLEKEGKCFYITDLNSTNGTYLNQKRLEANKRNLLQLEDEISLANVKYHFTFS